MSYLGFSQATPTETLRIANATTTMGKNLSIGKLVYNIADSLLYVTNHAVASTSTLTTGSTNFTLIGGVGSGIKSIQGDGNVLTTGPAISIDGAGIATTAVVGDVLTITAIEEDGSTTNEGCLTVEVGGANDSEIHSNTDGCDDVIISGGTGITVTESGQTITIATTGEVNLTLFTESFEESNASTLNPFTLSHAPVPASDRSAIRVSLNGVTLTPDVTNYTIAGTTLTIVVPILGYDNIVVTYNY